MSDLLLSTAARRLVGGLGLPIPLPARLRRDGGPWQERSLSGRITVVGSGASAGCLAAIAAGLAPAGAVPYLAVPDALQRGYRLPDARRALDLSPSPGQPAKPARDASERPPRGAPTLDALGPIARIDALVFDATGLDTVASLRSLFDFFQPLLRRLEPGAHIAVVARPAEGLAPEAAAAQAAIEGFVRSLAKELGRTGATVNLLRVTPGAEDRLGPVLRFILSGRASFITAQPLLITAKARAAASIPLMRPLDGKIALVTGAARGIGEVTARLLAREGAHVVCLDRPSDGGAATELAQAIGGTALLADITDEGAPARIAETLRGLGGVDVVVHNAGITRDKTLARMSADRWDGVLDVNLAAALRVSAAVEDLVRDGGRIIGLSSVAGLAGNVGQTAYAASKAGLAGWARSYAARVEDRGITVNAVAPGFIETRLTAAIPFVIREVARRLSALAQGGLPEDVAQAIVFLASPGAHGITGCTLRVCGGSFVGA
jgi:3-oxoacyl-[acyl-carrier protein] reductase